jgi:transposase
VRVEQVPWAARWQRVTKALSLALAKLAKMLSWKETAGQYQVGWKMVAAAVKTAVTEGLLRRKWKPLRVIGIDEVSRSKGQRYLTLVYDLERRRLVWIGQNRDADTMQNFFTWLGPRKARSILIVCWDMWAIYVNASERSCREREWCSIGSTRRVGFHHTPVVGPAQLPRAAPEGQWWRRWLPTRSSVVTRV